MLYRFVGLFLFLSLNVGDFFDDEILNVKDRENLVISDDIYKDREFISKLLDLEEDILNGSDGDMDLFDGLGEINWIWSVYTIFFCYQKPGINTTTKEND